MSNLQVTREKLPTGTAEPQISGFFSKLLESGAGRAVPMFSIAGIGYHARPTLALTRFGRIAMDEDRFNIALRKFLKVVGTPHNGRSSASSAKARSKARNSSCGSR
jgi:hypothetical protein